MRNSWNQNLADDTFSPSKVSHNTESTNQSFSYAKNARKKSANRFTTWNNGGGIISNLKTTTANHAISFKLYTNDNLEYQYPDPPLIKSVNIDYWYKYECAVKYKK